MRQRHISMAAASLAALILAIVPATAQAGGSHRPSATGTAPGSDSVTTNPNTRGNTDVNAGTESTETGRGSASVDCDAASSAPSASSRGTVSGDTSRGSVTGSTADDANESIDCQSPSASPPMGDDKARSDERDRDNMKQHEQLDKKNGLDRG